MLTTPLGLKKPQDTDAADLLVFVGDNMDALDTLISNKVSKQLTYTTTTAAGEGYYRIATIPMTSTKKNISFKIKAYTATGTVTESTIDIALAYYSGNYSTQFTTINANTSHSYNSWTNAETGYVLLYCRVSFDATSAYIDVYKYKTTVVTIETTPLYESDWVWATGTLTLNPTVGSYRNTQVVMEAGMRGNSLNAGYASYSSYSNYGVLGTNTLSNTTDKTGQWCYIGNWYLAYNSSYLRGHSGNIRVRIQELSYDGTIATNNLDDFVLIIKVGMAYHADANAFNTTIPTYSIEIDGKTSLTGNDIAALVHSTSTSTKYIRFYIKSKAANTVYCINPDQRYGRSFATSSYGQTTSYSYFNYAGDQTPIATLPTPAQGSIAYATKVMTEINEVNGLQLALDGKSSTGHNHDGVYIKGSISNTQPSSAVLNQIWIDTN